MFKISSVLVCCVFITISRALESNASLLESKVKSVRRDQDAVHASLQPNEYPYLVSLGDFPESGLYEHKCFGTMINNEKCLAVYAGCFNINNKLYVNAKRETLCAEENLPWISVYEKFDGFVKQKNLPPTGLVVAKLSYNIDNLPGLPLFYDTNHVEGIIGYDTQKNGILLRKINKYVAHTPTDSYSHITLYHNVIFHLNLKNGYFLTKEDIGAIVLADINEHFVPVGILTQIGGGVGIGILLNQYRHYIEEVMSI